MDVARTDEGKKFSWSVKKSAIDEKVNPLLCLVVCIPEVTGYHSESTTINVTVWIMSTREIELL